MRRKFSFRDFGVGAIVGLMIGTAGLSAASFGYEGWNKFSQDFKVGYITGFLAMSDLARNLDPDGYVDTKYPQVPKAKPVEWAQVIDNLYKKPDYQNYKITSMLQAAAHELTQKYGKIPPHERMRQRMQQQLEMLKKKREAEAAKKGLTTPEPPKHVERPEKQVPAVAPEKKPRKWCRCDGKDPKAERAKRRAARAEEEKKKAGAAAPAPTGAPSTPPAASPAPAEAPPAAH